MVFVTFNNVVTVIMAVPSTVGHRIFVNLIWHVKYITCQIWNFVESGPTAGARVLFIVKMKELTMDDYLKSPV